MSERPILFSGPMVRAIREGRKTQTRRVITNKQVLDSLNEVGSWDGPGEVEDWERSFCPYGKPGDFLWVRESFSYPRDGFDPLSPMTFWYWADGNPEDGDWTRPKPSIHMPRWASRITLRVKSVRVERLWDISDEDCFAEGISMDDEAYIEAERDRPLGWPVSSENQAFKSLWDSINGKRPGCDWKSNPWVWVVEFDSPPPSRKG
jgi:hypothetical protein